MFLVPDSHCASYFIAAAVLEQRTPDQREAAVGPGVARHVFRRGGLLLAGRGCAVSVLNPGSLLPAAPVTCAICAGRRTSMRPVPAACEDCAELAVQQVALLHDSCTPSYRAASPSAPVAVKRRLERRQSSAHTMYGHGSAEHCRSVSVLAVVPRLAAQCTGWRVLLLIQEGCTGPAVSLHTRHPHVACCQCLTI